MFPHQPPSRCLLTMPLHACFPRQQLVELTGAWSPQERRTSQKRMVPVSACSTSPLPVSKRPPARPITTSSARPRQPQDEMFDVMRRSDVTFTATGSKVPIIYGKDLQNLERNHMLVDISVPLNVAADCAEVDRVSSYSVDDLKKVVDANAKKRQNEVVKANKLITEEVQKFKCWQASQGAVPYLAALQAMAENIRRSEYAKMEHKLKGLQETEKEALDKLTRHLVDQLFRPLYYSMKEDESLADKRSKIMALQNIFRLEPLYKRGLLTQVDDRSSNAAENSERARTNAAEIVPPDWATEREGRQQYMHNSMPEGVPLWGCFCGLKLLKIAVLVPRKCFFGIMAAYGSSMDSTSSQQGSATSDAPQPTAKAKKRAPAMPKAYLERPSVRQEEHVPYSMALQMLRVQAQAAGRAPDHLKVPSLQLDGLVVENEAGDLEKLGSDVGGFGPSSDPGEARVLGGPSVLRGMQCFQAVECLAAVQFFFKVDVVVGVEETGRQTGSGKSLVRRPETIVLRDASHTIRDIERVCRLSATDDTNNGTVDCKGVEYNTETHRSGVRPAAFGVPAPHGSVATWLRCELWTQPILSHRSCITGQNCPEASDGGARFSRWPDIFSAQMSPRTHLGESNRNDLRPAPPLCSVRERRDAPLAPGGLMQVERTWAVEPPRSAKSIYQSSTTTGTFLRPTTAPVTTRFDPVPGLPNLVSGVPASPRSKRLVPHAHRMPSIPVRGATPRGPWAECTTSPRKGAWPRQGTENSLMFRNPLERRAAHDGWGEDVSLCASPAPGPQAQTTQATSGSELPTLQLR
ncbi:unnamed protein product [Durusdinium trenchii]|uniref:Uncharacterized protein n=1 Tax=Durusdinium trenchii TaxID=1381693 RepID=A0ABP0NCP0_9DINO